MATTSFEPSGKPLPGLLANWSMPWPAGPRPLLLDRESRELLSEPASQESGMNLRPPWYKRTTANSSRILAFLAGSSMIRSLAIALHVVLFLLHITLLAVYLTGLEKRVIMPISNDATHFMTIINSASQIFVIVYSALLLFLAQKLSLWRTLSMQQTLTASRDNTSAWIGLASAVKVLFQQVSTPAALGPTIAIMAYLAGLSLLHVTTPSLFGIQLINTTKPVQTWADGFSDIGDLAWNDVINGLGSYSHIPVESLLITQVIRDLSVIDGLLSGTIYDQVDGPETANLTVGALSLDVTCGYLENITASLKPLDTAIKKANSPEISTHLLEVPKDKYYISLDWRYENYSCEFAIPMPRSEYLGDDIKPAIYYLNPSCGSYKPAASAIFATGAIFQSVFSDSTQASNLSSLSLNGSVIPIPGIEEVLSQNRSYQGPVAFQISGCSLSYKKYNTSTYLAVITDNGSGITGVPELPQVVESESVRDLWNPWKPQFQLVNITYRQEATLIEAWPQVFSFPGSPSSDLDWISHDSTNIFCKSFSVNTPAYCGLKNTSIQEQFIRSSVSSYRIPELGMKSDFEGVLASMTATLYWNTITILMIFSKESLNFVEILAKMVSGELITPVSQLRLNLLPVIGGLCASFVLAALAILFARKFPKALANSVEGLDLLQIVWLVKHHPELFQEIIDVEVPSTEKLRAAGMVSVVLGGGINYDCEEEREQESASMRRSWRSSRTSD